MRFDVNLYRFVASKASSKHIQPRSRCMNWVRNGNFTATPAQQTQQIGFSMLFYVYWVYWVYRVYWVYWVYSLNSRFWVLYFWHFLTLDTLDTLAMPCLDRMVIRLFLMRPLPIKQMRRKVDPVAARPVAQTMVLSTKSSLHRIVT